MKLWHTTTQKKAALYRKTGRICSPVRGFTTEKAAMAWAMKVGRDVIIEFEANAPQAARSSQHVWECILE